LRDYTSAKVGYFSFTVPRNLPWAVATIYSPVQSRRRARGRVLQVPWLSQAQRTERRSVSARWAFGSIALPLSCPLSAEWHDATPNHMTSSDCKRLNPGGGPSESTSHSP
jgi:hypothetical protein